MVRATLALAVTGCVAPVVGPEPTEAPAVTWEVRDLWRGAVAEGARVTVTPLVVTSPRDIDRGAFFAAAPDGSRPGVIGDGSGRSGLRVVLGQAIDDWPLPVGSAFTATGVLVQQQPPVLWVSSAADLGAIDAVDLEVTPVALGDTTARELLELRFALVVARDTTVTSVPDPLGHADGTVAPVGGRFGVSPGYGRSGDLTGILGEDLRVSARSTEDWTGDLVSDPPLEGATLSKLDGIPAGTPLVIPDLVMATQWSRDLRWAVVQDADGAGAWVDGEGWGLWGKAARGQLGQWTAEVRYDDDGVYLRTWIPPRVRATGTVLVGKEQLDGAIVWFAAPEVGEPDAYGERPAGDLLLDDRFVDLSGLPADAAIAGVGAVRGGALAPIWFEVR